MEIARLREGDLDAFVEELWLPAKREMASMTVYELDGDARRAGRSHYRSRLADDETVTYVGREDGALVGYVSAEIRAPAPIFESVRECHVSDVYVAPEIRRRGAGRALLDAAEEWGRVRDCAHLDLNVDADNEAARSLYEDAGLRAERYNMKKPLD
ncbi:acetyltransferase, GNAT family [Halarchaeum acidiphilum MH1-52-1]|uniref:Acetyltransferase, GNAT family n=2 Tax=Halarchaeum acidiphilum TaxID=489138 RepID=U2YUD1_9EURY|nr:GNAT family N-acetyltransferase [Halarchaeum acidiphilum]GAD52625.1 acetyltransferase, GNAT family [Halarchaeum acidiphilum MH1-52-1]